VANAVARSEVEEALAVRHRWRPLPGQHGTDAARYGRLVVLRIRNPERQSREVKLVALDMAGNLWTYMENVGNARKVRPEVLPPWIRGAVVRSKAAAREMRAIQVAVDAVLGEQTCERAADGSLSRDLEEIADDDVVVTPVMREDFDEGDTVAKQGTITSLVRQQEPSPVRPALRVPVPMVEEGPERNRIIVERTCCVRVSAEMLLSLLRAAGAQVPEDDAKVRVHWSDEQRGKSPHLGDGDVVLVEWVTRSEEDA
jgi:hypothetical protein